MQIYLPIAEMPVSVLLILGMGAAVGFISGLFGIGGGFLMTPLLIFLGIPPAVAVATQSAQIVASSNTSVLNAFRRKALDFKLGGVLVAGGFVGSVLGVWFFAAARRAGQLDVVIVVSYVTLFTVVGSLMLKESVSEFWTKRRGGTVRVKRQAGEHAAYLFWPLRMRFYRSKLYASVIPILAFRALRRVRRRAARNRRRLHHGSGAFVYLPGSHQHRRRHLAIPDRVHHPGVADPARGREPGGRYRVGDAAHRRRRVRGAIRRAEPDATCERSSSGSCWRSSCLAVGIRFALELVVTPNEFFSITTQELRT